MPQLKKVLTIMGTRPEAIKLAPIIQRLETERGRVLSRVCVTAQHREMLDQVMGIFGIVPDVDLDLMRPGQSLAEITARVFSGIDGVFEKEKPDLVLIQGDTTTVMAAAIGAFYRGIPLGHVEAGLRSGDLFSPFPEEMNRRVATVVSSFHFAPTERAAAVLRKEGVPEDRIYLTGNPVIDALQFILSRPVPEKARAILGRAGIIGGAGDPRLILVTGHRRENFGERFESLCRGLGRLVERHNDVTIIYPVHLNPNVQEPVQRILGQTERIMLIDPVEYDVMACLMKNAYLVLTDSGGVQEEAPALGKPVLVMRTETERPEGVKAGTARLVGPFEERIVAETEVLLTDRKAYERMARAVNPYGDGHAAERILDIILERI